ncbi:hypothetical protein [Ralstonia pseudosolanacearum]
MEYTDEDLREIERGKYGVLDTYSGLGSVVLLLVIAIAILGHCFLP